MSDKCAEQTGWKATGTRIHRGHVVSDEIGVFDSWIDADQAADLYHRSNRKSLNVLIDKHYGPLAEET